jgi:hypothetical protein
METNVKKTDIFWTGGLDSTFRLVQLLTSDMIQPHYILRSEDSTGNEIDAQIQIRRMIVNQFPEVRSRFLPTIYTNGDLIPSFEDINEQINELSKTIKVREQYKIMSNYCRAFNIDQIEVSLIRLSGEHGPSFENFNSPAFKSFFYPILEITKKELYKTAKKNHWNQILKQTSFCRRPRKKIRPCGLCGPCADAVESGMGFRFPILPYFKARLQIPLRKYWRKNYLKQDKSKFLRMIKRNFENRF